MNPPTYERRGRKTLVVLLILRLIPAFLFLIAVVAVASYKTTIAEAIEKATNQDITPFLQSYSLIVNVGLLIFVLLSALLLLFAWLEYIGLSYVLDQHSFRTRTGIVHIHEASIPYRQIQNVTISRPLLYRLLGMSRIVILTAGHEDNDTPEEAEIESEGVIDMIEKLDAETLQHELLDRSHVQVVKEIPQANSEHRH
ncbi:MAG: Bacterial domain [Candidatus Paceibacter sp.]|jgi:uncharacterized membrane protein YdbT with pleckstrin-like domain|nr:Bacterial domain [Candidatus Paceibacter sp.]